METTNSDKIGPRKDPSMHLKLLSLIKVIVFRLNIKENGALLQGKNKNK